MTRLVILGAGFAGRTVAARMQSSAAVTAIDRENYSLFTPMLPEVASGSIEPRHIAAPLRTALPKSTVEFAEIEAVDVERCTITVRDRIFDRTKSIAYDHLVIALGATTTMHHVPGAHDNAYPLRTLEDASRLRDRILGVLEIAATTDDTSERARLCAFVVIGGGFTGVEAAGELLSYLRTITRFYPIVEAEDVSVTLVAGGDRLLEQLPERLGRRAAEMLHERGVRIVRDDDVASVDGGGATLKSGLRLETRTVIWSAGVKPSPLLEKIDVPRSKHGAVVVNADLSVPNRRGIWALGDCAQVPQPSGGFYAQTAQNAVEEGRLLARNLSASLRGRPTKPFAYESRGMMASIGAREGIAEIGGRTLTGFPAWLLWRAYYLMQLPGLDRRARVAADWALSTPSPANIARTT